MVDKPQTRTCSFVIVRQLGSDGYSYVAEIRENTNAVNNVTRITMTPEQFAAVLTSAVTDGVEIETYIVGKR